MKQVGVFLAALLLLSPQINARLLHSGGTPPLTGLSLLQMAGGHPGVIAFPIIGNGKFTGSAPSSMTATISGCGGGSLSVSALITPSYGPGTYQVQMAQPSAAGTGCTITVMDNLGRSATSPSFSAISTPGSEVVSQIHNAPGWQSSHGYAPASGPKTRVLNGPGWSRGAFVPGALLRAYELTSSSCTSASSGGPTGTGASISDGTCTWKYLSNVDYITISGWSIDAPLWVSGKTYAYYEFVTINDGGTLRAYLLDGTNANAFCASTVAPTGTGSPGGLWSTGSQQTADGCYWDYLGDVTYSSQVSYMPVQTYSLTWGAVSHEDRSYTAEIWNDAEYVAGSGGERSPITVFQHSESALGMEAAYQGASYIVGVWTTLKAAPGESFRDSMTTSTPLAGYDVTKGVAIRNASTTSAPIFAATSLGAGPAGLFVWDAAAAVDGLQIKSAAGMGLYLHDTSSATNNIIDGGWVNGLGGWCSAVYQDSAGIFVNNLVLSHGCSGISYKYGNSFALYNTLVNVGSESNTTALLYGWSWVTQDIALANSAIYGYAHVAGELSGLGPSPLNSRGVGNVTNVTGPDDTGTTWWIDGSPAISNVVAAPGTTFGVSGSSMFVSPGSDYRPSTALTNSGSAFGAFYINCLATPGSCIPIYQTMDTPDVLGNARPNGSRQISSGLEQKP